MAETRTQISDVIESFESSFQDKSIVPYELELLWLKKAIAQYSTEIADIALCDKCDSEFTEKLNQYTVDTLAQMMKVYYMEREVSKVNKRVSIVSKDISIDGNNGSKTAARNELDYNDVKMQIMTANQKTPAYN